MGTVGTSHYGVKVEIQVTKLASVRLLKHNTGAELPVVVKKLL